jgi:hypothetical protein
MYYILDNVTIFSWELIEWSDIWTWTVENNGIIIRAMKTKCVARGSQWSKINGKVFDVILLYLRTKLEPVDLK